MSQPFYRMETPRESSGTVDEIEKSSTVKSVRVTTVPVPFECSEEEAARTRPDPARGQSLVERWWLWELSAWLVCTAALLGMVGFLAPADQKPVPKWVVSGTIRGYTLGFSVSINSVLSIFSTVVKSAVMIPVAASISQLKWLWFSDGHKLSDFQRFEAAKSGPLGAVLLLWAMKGRQLVCLGALITIGSLALDFSFQQLVTYPPTPWEVSQAYMPATPTYSNYALTAPSGIAGIAYQMPDSRMSSALKIGLDGIDATVDIIPDCPSGNCTWPDTITSVAVCSECFDATEELIKNCGTIDNGAGPQPYCNYSYPNGLELPGLLDSSGTQTLFATSGETSNTTFFQDIKSPIGILSTIGNTHGNQTLVNVSGSQCALFWCVKKYKASINQTVLTEKLVDTYRDNAATPDDSGDLHIAAPESFMNGTAHNGSFRFTVTNNASTAMSYYFYTNAHFDGSIEQTPTLHSSTPTDMVAYLWPLDNAGLTQAMEWLAGNMTNAIRMSNKATSAGNTNAIGITWQNIPKVNVVWWWVAVPGGLILLSLLFLVLTMVSSSRRGAMLWKGSALATFYHPLARDGREKLGQATGPKDLEQIADELQVKAERTEKGHRLVRPGS